MVVLDGNFALGREPGNGLPLNKYISMYARTKRCYSEGDSRTNYVRSSVPHCTYSMLYISHVISNGSFYCISRPGSVFHSLKHTHTHIHTHTHTHIYIYLK